MRPLKTVFNRKDSVVLEQNIVIAAEFFMWDTITIAVGWKLVSTGEIIAIFYGS